MKIVKEKILSLVWFPVCKMYKNMIWILKNWIDSKLNKFLRKIRQTTTNKHKWISNFRNSYK